MTSPRVYDLIGVGLGVFNLSLAALLDENGFDDVLFFEKQPQLNWHGGMLLDSSELQVHFLKDLVTPVEPTSRYSFLNYLSQRGLMYQFMNRKSDSISRNQFQHYFRWVAEQLDTVRFNAAVQAVEHDGECFLVSVGGEQYRARHLAVASGLDPFIPACAQPFLGDRVFHVAQYAQHRAGFGEADVAVIGGGQSGAEVVMDILDHAPAASLRWFSRQLWFAQLEDNCFVNELYIPSFTRTFRKVEQGKREDFVARLSQTSDGINQGLIDRIYRHVFERRFFSARQDFAPQFLAGHEMVGMRPVGERFEVEMRSWADQRNWTFVTDVVVLATGFRAASWRMLEGVLGEPGPVPIGEHFDVQWRHAERNHLFVQNGSRMCVGLADANLSIAAWRSAMIVNKLLGRERYARHPDSPMVGHLLQGEVA